MLLALRIEVDSLAATREAVPRLLEALQRHGAGASFYFNFGPDRGALAHGPLFEIGRDKRQRKLNRALLGPQGWARGYGRPLPAPRVGEQAAAAIRAVREAGFDTGVLAWDRAGWVRQIGSAGQDWVAAELAAACSAHAELCGEPPRATALPGWRLNRAALRQQQQLGLEFGSDTRGRHPFYPVVDGEPVRVPQLPTTLPTLAELIGDGHDEDGAVAAILARSERIPLTGHVFTVQAAADGGKRLPLLERLLAGWHEQGHEITSLARLYKLLDRAALPWHSVLQQPSPLYGGTLAEQGPAFPG